MEEKNIILPEPQKYMDDGITPTLAYWRSLFIFYGLTPYYADITYKKCVRGGKWISHHTLAENIKHYRLIAKDYVKMEFSTPQQPKLTEIDPKPLVPWYMDLPPQREEPTISPEEQAEIDEIRNRIIAKFH